MLRGADAPRLEADLHTEPHSSDRLHVKSLQLLDLHKKFKFMVIAIFVRAKHASQKTHKFILVGDIFRRLP